MFNVEFEEVTNQFCAEFDTIVHVSDANLGTKTITENDTYYAEDDGLDGYSEVTVNVSGGGGTLETITKTYTPTTSQQTEQITPSSGYDGIGEVDVTVNAIPSQYIIPTGTKSISSNGIGIDVKAYEYADVAVPNSYSAADEGKVVSSGALVAQTSDTVTENDTYDTTLINSLTVNVSGGRVLPSGYTQVEFIMASGTQYLEVNYTPVQNDHVSTKFLKPAAGDTALFSVGTGTYQWLVLGNYYRYFSSGNAASFSPSFTPGRVYELEADSSATAKSAGLTTSTATKAYGGAIDGSNNKLNIARRANNASFYSGYIYEFIITNNGTKKIDLIPCIQDSTGKVGMYELLSDTFYSSLGSNEFYAGPEVITDSEALSIMLGGE